MTAVSIVKIIGYVGGENKRPFIEGEAVINANHILLCGKLKSDNPKTQKYRALCLQSSHINALPHEINLSINEGEISEAHCTCKAGNSKKCKHVIAVLFFLNRTSISQIEDLSSTSMAQQWGKLSKANQGKELYESIPIKQWCHPKDLKLKEYKVSEEDREKIKNILLEGDFQTELQLFLKGRNDVIFSSNDDDDPQEYLLTLALAHKIIGDPEHMVGGEDGFYYKELNKKTIAKFSIKDLPEKLLKYYNENVAVTCEQAADLAAKTADQIGSVWLNERKKRITGSQCYELYTYSRNKNPDWVGKFDRLSKKIKPTAAMLHGIKYEKEAIEVYQSKTGNKVEKLGLIVLPQIPWAGYSSDGLAYGVSGARLVEVKNPVKGQIMRALDVAIESTDFLVLNRDAEFELKKKHKYYGQVQLGMAICNLKVCDFIVYSSCFKDFVLVTVPFDEPFVNSLLQSLKFVYFEYKLPYLVTKSEEEVDGLNEVDHDQLNVANDDNDGLNEADMVGERNY